MSAFVFFVFPAVFTAGTFTLLTSPPSLFYYVIPASRSGSLVPQYKPDNAEISVNIPFLFTNSIRLTILPGARAFIDKPFMGFSL